MFELAKFFFVDDAFDRWSHGAATVIIVLLVLILICEVASYLEARKLTREVDDARYGEPSGPYERLNLCVYGDTLAIDPEDVACVNLTCLRGGGLSAQLSYSHSLATVILCGGEELTVSREAALALMSGMAEYGGHIGGDATKNGGNYDK